jgi:CHAT domain-containing protein
MRRVLVGLAVAALAGAFVWQRVRGEAESPARREAEQLYRQGLDHQLALHGARAFENHRAAILRDPTFLPPFFETVSLLSGIVAPKFMIAFLDSLAMRVPDARVGACITNNARLLRGLVVAVPSGNAGTTAARDCEQYLRATAWPATAASSFTIAARELWQRNDEDPAILGAHLAVLSDNHRWSELLALARRMGGSHEHALVRAVASSFEAYALHELGRDADAIAAEQRARADPAWRHPGFRVRYYSVDVRHGDLLARRPDVVGDSIRGHMASALREAIDGYRTAVDAGDAQSRATDGARAALHALDGGRLDEALVAWIKAAAAADEVNDASLRAQAHMRLGRTYVKLGRLPEGEAELLRARALVAHDTLPLTQKEIEHNLLHLYESLADYPHARSAGAEFVRFAEFGGLHAVRMMSARDVARLLRTHGELEESRRFYERMLNDIDSLGTGQNYAAEYYELTGDLDRARKTYLADTASGTRALDGLVRTSLAIGDTAAARHYAQLHDMRRTAQGVPESAALLPGVLAKTGRIAQARRAFDVARSDVGSHGQLAAWAALTLQLAELERVQGVPARAAALADSAAHGARRVASTDVALRATGLAAVARVEAGLARGVALDAVGAAEREAERSGYPALRADLRRLHAEALAAAGDWRAALDRFRAAAQLTDSIAAVIALDQEQAGYRSAQRRVYDRALAAIVSHAAEAGAPALYAEWTRRRKSRGFAAEAVPANAPLPRPGPGRAVIDYVLLDSAAAAFVITERETRLIVLPTRADSVRATVRRMRAALDVRIGDAIDLSHIRFPFALAHELYRQLLAPLEPLLRGATALTIVPDGVLALVPFDALVVTPPSSEAFVSDVVFVLDRFVVTEATMLGVDTRRWSLPDGPVVAVLPALGAALNDEAAREADAIRRVVPAGRTVLLSGAHATERSVRAAAPRAAVLHFAAHAYANENDPASSRIALAPDAQNDGALHAYEIAEMQLAGSLVVLTACETATGRVLDGEGVLSLSRSFLRAGAHATIATLWPVGPGTADFVAAFYQSLASGAEPSSALRSAKLALRRGGVAPFVWAPYKLVTRSVPRPR